MKMHELLSDKSKWTKGTCARDKNGIATSVNSHRATCWCLAGANIKCYGGIVKNDTVNTFKKIKERLGMRMVAWNDAPERTFEEVQNLLKELDI